MKNDPKFRKGYIVSRVLFTAGIVLIVVGGSLDENDPSTAKTLVKAGYIIMAIFILCLVLLQGYFWRMLVFLSASSTKVSSLPPSSYAKAYADTNNQVMQGMAAAIPFLLVRMVYMFLSIFHPDHEKWNALQGALGPYVVMVLVMEYVVVCIYLMTGFHIPATKEGPEGSADILVESDAS
ncbi:hypothetical protein N7510_009250 [Penicillium lagena]|uniref:uncharacterized protein n=1 Tax=Penicillium lagena TaxID=94218 RepID=UPI00254123A2|nr:uncharacterized protein N7510_009250 [Penicillium lagena]KAJ5606469.1 hypothetical protein N7510_009250 [Penicillium lagena]